LTHSGELSFPPKGGSFKRNLENPLDCVVDETSMVDVLRMHAVLKALPRTAALFVVGDVDQLPSVGPGQILANLNGSGVIPVVTPHRGFPASCEEPHYRFRPSDKPRLDARIAKSGGLLIE
jgi:ATP-dependent exoDNAse (exonuclease V) alpha subunit